MNNLVFFCFVKNLLNVRPCTCAKGDGSFFPWFFNVHCLFRNLNVFRRLYYVYFMFCFILFFLKFRGPAYLRLHRVSLGGQTPKPHPGPPPQGGYCHGRRGHFPELPPQLRCSPLFAKERQCSYARIKLCLFLKRKYPKGVGVEKAGIVLANTSVHPYGGCLRYVFPVPRALYPSLRGRAREGPSSRTPSATVLLAPLSQRGAVVLRLHIPPYGERPTFSPCIQTCLHVKIAPAGHPGAHFAGLLNCYSPLMPRKNRYTNAIKLQKLLNIIMYIAFFNHYSYNFSTLRSTEKQRTGDNIRAFPANKSTLSDFNFI